MTTITQSITTLPTAPDPATMTPAAFSTAAAAYVLAQKAMVPQLNTWAGQVNTVAGEVNTNATNAASSAVTAGDAEDAAMGAANYVGAWSGLTGALAIPASVSHSSKIWLLLSSLGDVTASEPGVSGDWQNITPYGGIANIATATTSTTLTSTQTLLKFTPPRYGEAITLPDATTCAEGGPLHIIDMSESTYPARVLNSAGSLIGVMFPGVVSQVSLPDNTTATGPWAIENIKRVGPVAQILSANLRGNAKIVDLGNSQELILATNASNHLYGVVYNRSTNVWGAVTAIRAAAVAGNYSAVLCAADKVLVVSAVTTALEAVVLTIAAGDISAVGTPAPATLSASISFLAAAGAEMLAIGDAFVFTYRTTTPAMEIRSVAVSGTTPTISPATVMSGTNGGLLSFAGSVAVVANYETSVVHIAPYTISGSAAPVLGTKVSDAVTGSGTIYKFKKMDSGRWVIIYLDNNATLGGFVTLTGTTITTSIVTIFSAASYDFSDAFVVESNKVLCTTSANSSPCYNILTDTAGTASAGTAIDIEAVALTRTCLYADGTNVVVYAFSSTKFYLQTIDCSGASPVLSKTSNETNLANTDVSSFYQSNAMFRRYPGGVYGATAAYMVPTWVILNPHVVDGNLSLVTRDGFFGQSAFLGASAASVWVSNSLTGLTKVECVA